MASSTTRWSLFGMSELRRLRPSLQDGSSYMLPLAVEAMAQKATVMEVVVAMDLDDFILGEL